MSVGFLQWNTKILRSPSDLNCKGELLHVHYTIIFSAYVWTTGRQTYDTNADGV
jgi:hypothetical protein